MKRVSWIFLSGALLILFASCARSEADPESGQNLSVTKGCAACHAVDDTPKIGPSWVGLYESEVDLVGGGSVIADEEYLIESTLDPNAKIVSGYSEGSMPVIPLTEDELNAVVAYIKSVR